MSRIRLDRATLWSAAAAAVVVALPIILVVLNPGAPTTFDSTTVASGAEVAALDRVHEPLSMRALSSIRLPDGRASTPIPSEILALDGRRVAVEGYMLPLEMTPDGVNHFMLTGSFDSCMFGLITPVTGRIDVTVSRGRHTLLSHMPIRVYGTLHVRPSAEDGWIVGLYQMDAERLDLGPH